MSRKKFHIFTYTFVQKLGITDFHTNFLSIHHSSFSLSSSHILHWETVSGWLSYLCLIESVSMSVSREWNFSKKIRFWLQFFFCHNVVCITWVDSSRLHQVDHILRNTIDDLELHTTNSKILLLFVHLLLHQTLSEWQWLN